MVANDFEKMMKEGNYSKEYVEELARQHQYILNWEKGTAFGETRCGWREEMMMRRAMRRECI